MSKAAQSHDQGSSVGKVDGRFFTFAEPSDTMPLESGARLGPITLAYETYGELAANQDNAVLVLHALSGDAHAAGIHRSDDPKPGWWDTLIGPGKGIDTSRYLVICSNVLGGCMGSTGPSSINPATNRPYGLDFPMITIGDMVAAQKRLIDALGIPRLLAVIGGSMGGMQVLDWSVRYPEMVFAAIPLATTMRHSALAIAFNEVARQAIMADPHWQKGCYYDGKHPDLGLAVARMIGHITYLSDDALRNRFGRKLQDRNDFSCNFGADFQVESYLRHQGKKFVDRFDANSFLYLTRAADYFDLLLDESEEHVATVFAKALARFLVVSFTSDWLYPTYQSRAMVTAMKRAGRDVSFCEIEAPCGHDAFLLPIKRLATIIKGFLDRVHTEFRK